MCKDRNYRLGCVYLGGFSYHSCKQEKESDASATFRPVPNINLPPIHLRAVAVGAAKLEDQVGVGALVEDGVLATGVARRVSVRAVTRLARRARDAEAIGGATGEEFEALLLEGVAEDGAQVVVGPVGVGADVVDGLQRAAEVGLAGDGDGGLLDVGAGDGSGEGVVFVGGDCDHAGGGVALTGLEVEREVALVVNEDLGCGGRGDEADAREQESGELHGC